MQSNFLPRCPCRPRCLYLLAAAFGLLHDNITSTIKAVLGNLKPSGCLLNLGLICLLGEFVARLLFKMLDLFFERLYSLSTVLELILFPLVSQP